MLVRAGIDSAALLVGAGDGSAAFRSANRQLLHLLRAHGLLVFANQQDANDVVSAVRSMPQAVRKLWTTVLPDVLTTSAFPPTTVPLKDVQSADDLATHWADRIQVGFFDQRRAVGLGLPPEEAVFIHAGSDIEVVRIDLSAESERFRRALQIAALDIPRHADRADVWRERFEPLARATKTVTILDRYSVKRLLQGQGHGLQWFLERLDQAGPVNVHLIAELDTASQIQRAVAAVQALRGRLRHGGIQSLSVTFANRAAFRDAAHSRHVRLGRVAVLIDRGLQTFDTQLCAQSTPCRPCDRAAALEREHDIERTACRRARRHIAW